MTAHSLSAHQSATGESSRHNRPSAGAADLAMEGFLHNAWYVAAFSREIDRALFPLKLLDESVVLYRTSAGEVAALEDACPHRKLPLSMGRLKGDAVECGYHGLTFDVKGSCIDAATQSRIPPLACVRSYPVRERYGLVWIWMGEPERAVSTPLIDIEHHDDPNWHLSPGDSLLCRCHYLWLVDNLLDPSHVAWVHRSSFAGAGTEDTPLQIHDDDQGVVCSRWLLNRPPPPYYAPLLKFEGNADRLQHYEVRYPSIAINKSTFAPAGQGGETLRDGPQVYRMVSYNFLTPIDADSTRYFWLQHRNTDPHDHGITQGIAAAAKSAFEEDRLVLEAVHQGMKHRRTPTTGLMLDAAASRFRKALAAKIAAESPQA
jgi:phenylpropionate dioxygenase-like ring-hydroxylating dioxygenase large terminal subunit